MLLKCFNLLLLCRLAEVGKLETPKIDVSYEVGQIFLHRVFGYRGVILFPWLAKVYDRDQAVSTKAKDKYVHVHNSYNA